MRLKLTQIVTILLIAGSGDARPQKIEVADFQPKIDAKNTEGWRPVQHGENVAQDSIPVGKDLPQIVEGNSRYKEEGRTTRRKSYAMNNLFYEDHIPVVDKRSDRLNQRLGIQTFRAKVIHEDISQSKESGDRKSVPSFRVIENAGRIYPFLASEGFSGTKNIANPAIVEGTKIHSYYRGKIKSGPLSLGNSTNVNDPLDFGASTTWTSRNMSQTRIGDSSNVKPEIISHSRVISYGHKAARVKEEKVTSDVKIFSIYDVSKNATKKTSIPQDNLLNLSINHSIRNQVFRPDLFNSLNGVEHYKSNSSDLVTTSKQVTINETSERSERRSLRKNIVRVKPQAHNNSPKGGHHKTTGLKNGSDKFQNVVRFKPNSNQSLSNWNNLKNWPNGKLQNVQDLYNYEKYTFFDNEDDNLEEHVIANHSIAHENLGNVHQVTKKPVKRPTPILISDQLLPPNIQTDATNIYESESHAGLEQTAQDDVQWEQIHSVVFNKSDVPITDENENDSNEFDPIPEGLDPNRPLNAEDEDTQSSNSYEYINGGLNGDNPTLEFAPNYNDHLVPGEEYQENQNVQQNFENPYLQAVVTRPVDGTLNDYENSVVYKPAFNPTSVVSQNTVVHILNAGKKRPNVTVTEIKGPSHNSSVSLNPEDSLTGSKNSSSSSPNVHIMFTTQEDENEELGDLQYGLTVDQQKPEVTYDDSLNCPTILINSYTRINNTVESKEGCTDLNIIINSHVLNTNVFNPAAQSHKTDDKVPSERYPGNSQAQTTYGTYDGGYGTFPTQSGQVAGGSAPGDFQDIPVNGGQIFQGNIQSPGTSVFEVFQQTQINVESQNDVPSLGDSLDTVAPSQPLNDEPGVVDSGPSNPFIVPEIPVSNDPASLPGFADDPGPTGIADDPPVNAIQAPAADAPVNAAADSPASPGSGGLQLPGGINPLSGITDQFSDAVGNLGSQNGDSGLGSQGSILGDDDDDDDDDDMMELMPFSIIESVTSILPFFTMLNPLNYGFLSLAISPFAVVAAGIFGIAAAVVPFAFRSAFNFGRSTDQVTIKVKPSFEETVRESIHRYENWNEWKSKRKKRRK